MDGGGEEESEALVAVTNSWRWMAFNGAAGQARRRAQAGGIRLHSGVYIYVLLDYIFVDLIILGLWGDETWGDRDLKMAISTLDGDRFAGERSPAGAKMKGLGLFVRAALRTARTSAGSLRTTRKRRQRRPFGPGRQPSWSSLFCLSEFHNHRCHRCRGLPKGAGAAILARGGGRCRP
jgi:hypothetical protein